ncbi:class I SAM-dependent methyltransferase [Dethiosulfatarculus sandiegensis]|uniref:Tetracenomycin polyketide synthesis O-methyltransferase TcmP n=1 Tax=Dethiosulfatarculus sandiegensis TaxID=1429043 RepID=A0A0D2JD60_9BACT|nr:class I SAM-dependent methyltransferase [Dethiosulfatarculus sandiegensis]KIX13676.1 tetracenomycin polyketide synthesis O-methyltransferase TcmP [Dethiosulfatarculus sandiegensis]
MAKIDVSKLNSVAETLLLPLYSRARESGLKNGIMHDQKARMMVEQIDWRFEPLKKIKDYVHFCVILRAREIDRQVRAFLASHPEGTVVELGCGLDTRFERLDNGKTRFVLMDFPETFEIYERFFEPHPRKLIIKGSFLDLNWAQKVKAFGKGPILFISEGVLMYLYEQQVRNLFGYLNQNFAPTQIVFDSCTPMVKKNSSKHVMVKLTKAKFNWGIKDPKKIESWLPGLIQLNKWYYFDQPEPRLGWTKLLRFIPPIAKSNQISRFAFQGAEKYTKAA